MKSSRSSPVIARTPDAGFATRKLQVRFGHDQQCGHWGHNSDHIARAHQEAFGASRPASTLVQVAALTPPSALVEIEVTAFVHD